MVFFVAICAKRCCFEWYSFCELVILLIYMWLTSILKNCFFVLWNVVFFVGACAKYCCLDGKYFCGLVKLSI